MRRHEPGYLDRRVERVLAKVPWTHISGPYQALDLRFGLRTCDTALGSYLADLLLPFATDGSVDGVLWFSGLDRVSRGSPAHVTYAGGRRLRATPSRRMMLNSLLWAFNQEVVAGAEGCLLLHASAVERDGVVVVLPAAQESGKTTLCAALLRHGYRYVTDEAVAVDVDSGRVRPFPKALSVDQGSWPLFPELAPRLAPEQRLFAEDQWHLPASRFAAAIADPTVAVPRVLLSPSHCPGVESRIAPLRPAEALLLLLENSFNLQDWGQAGLTAAARMVQGCSTLGRLSVDDLQQACELVDHAVDRALAHNNLKEPRS